MEAVLRSLRNMTVPKLSQVHSGVGVNIVLKEHQRTGKITTGQVADILTRGDHPRGIKVRLRSGHIGRVQSLSSVHFQGQRNEQCSTSPSRPSSRDSDQNLQPNPLHSSRLPAARADSTRYSISTDRGRLSIQSVYREDAVPTDSRSLADYIKAPRKAAPPKPFATDTDTTLQSQMTTEFPSLDSALIAAILADYPGEAEARDVLQSLS